MEDIKVPRGHKFCDPTYVLPEFFNITKCSYFGHSQDADGCGGGENPGVPVWGSILTGLEFLNGHGVEARPHVSVHPNCIVTAMMLSPPVPANPGGFAKRKALLWSGARSTLGEPVR
jgi:hypothetical protein